MEPTTAVDSRPGAENIDPRIPALNDSIAEAFDVKASRGVVIQRFAVAGLRIETRIAGVQLSRLMTRPFAPMQTQSADEPDLVWTVCEGDGEIPSAPTRDLHGTLFAGRDHDMIAERWLFSDTVFDPVARTIRTITRSPSELTLYERAKPLLRVLNLSLYECGILITHAALIGRDGRGVLVTGRGGMGKTTTSAVALLRGLEFLSDDFVAVEARADGYFGHMLFNSLMLEQQHIKRLPRLAEIADYPKYKFETKALAHPDGLEGARLQQRLKIVAVLVPAIVDRTEGGLLPLSKGEALRALGPSSVFASPRREKSRFDFYQTMLARLPCYRLELGSDLDRLVDPLETLLC